MTHSKCKALTSLSSYEAPVSGQNIGSKKLPGLLLRSTGRMIQMRRWAYPSSAASPGRPPMMRLSN